MKQLAPVMYSFKELAHWYNTRVRDRVINARREKTSPRVARPGSRAGR